VQGLFELVTKEVISFSFLWFLLFWVDCFLFYSIEYLFRSTRHFIIIIIGRMEFEGKITHILDVETIGENSTPKQTVVMEEVTDRKYPASITLDFRRDKVELLANVTV
jgi:hypothetical protein